MALDLLDDLKETRIRIFQKIILGFLLLMVILLPAILLPLYEKLKEEKQNNLTYILETKKLTLNQYLDNLVNIITQINSRTQIKIDLQNYYSGKINRQYLEQSTLARIQDAMKNAGQLKGLTRLDRKFQPVVQLGVLPEHSFIQSNTDKFSEIHIFPPAKNYIIISGPIKQDGIILGYDLGIFETESFYKILADSSLKDKAAFIVTGNRNGKTELFFTNHQDIVISNGSPVHPDLEHFTRKTRLKNGWDLYLIYHTSELYKIIQYTIYATFAFGAVIILTGLMVLLKIIAPALNLLDEKRKNISTMLFMDSLTNLGNRTLLKVNITGNQPVALMIIDIENFNEINDFYGNDAGDYIIQNLSRLLQDDLPADITKLYSLGGDEFAVIFNRVPDDFSMDQYIKKLLKKIETTPFNFKNSEIFIHVNIGLTNSPPYLETADVALKRAKQDTEQHYIAYDESLQFYESIRNNYDIINKIREALDNGNLVPFYQPIVEISSGKIIKYECLARIIDKDNKIILPVKFMDIAKKTYLYPAITRTMIANSLKKFSATSFEFSINLSTLDLLNSDTIAYLSSELDKYPAITGGSRFTIEILETEGIQDYDKIIRIILELKNKYNIKISIDDFGAGFSNFSRVMELQPEYIKIDSSLIMNIHKNKKSEAIVKSIVDFSGFINAKTIAEYVHSEAVKIKIEELGIDWAQGFYYYPPLPEL